MALKKKKKLKEEEMSDEKDIESTEEEEDLVSEMDDEDLETDKTSEELKESKKAKRKKLKEEDSEEEDEEGIDLDDDEDLEDEELELDDDELEEGKKKLKEGITASFKGKELSESFVNKIEGLLESHSTLITNSIKNKFNKKLKECVKNGVEKKVKKLLEALDTHSSLVADEWLQQNQVAVASQVKVDLAESIFSELKVILEKRDISMPKAVGAISLLESKNEELVEQLRETKNLLQNTKVVLREEKIRRIFNECASDLSELEKDKFINLCEGVSFSNEKAYAEKLITIKESVFGESAKKSSGDQKQTLVESFNIGRKTSNKNVDESDDFTKYSKLFG